MCAARTGSCSWTRSAPPRSIWSSPTPARTRAVGPRFRRACRWGNCSTRSTRAHWRRTAARGRDHVIVRQPLQPFDARNFVAGGLGVDTPFSFDPSGLAGARAASGERHDVPPLVSQPLDAAHGSAPSTSTISSGSCSAPARAFLRQRLGISTYDEDDDPADALPVELDGLQTWAIGDRVLRNRLAGMAVETCVDIEWRRGELPPGPLGQAISARRRSQYRRAARGVPARTRDGAAVRRRRRLPRRRTNAVRHGGRRTRRPPSSPSAYSSLSGRQRLAAWVRHLAVVAALDRRRAAVGDRRPLPGWGAPSADSWGRPGHRTPRAVGPDRVA